ncbi:MAG: dihydroorotate dehydrogenase electron transfer subunit [Planctomycetota bacterium]
MTNNPLHASCYADSAVHAEACEVLENVQVAQATFRMRFRCAALAERMLPGQFFMVRVTGCDDPLIGRPFAFYDGDADWVDFVYLVEGKMTTRLARMSAGEQVDVWGPLGNGFLPQPCKHLIMVAGGIGQTPFLAVARERLGSATYGSPARAAETAESVTLCYGARTRERLAGVEDFRAAGVDVQIATDDGSEGHHGFVTDLLNRRLDQSTEGVNILCCGPEPMMAAVSQIAIDRGVPCWASLEEPMACGVGICFTCVAKIKDASGEWDYKRTCVEGPVFAASSIDWSH